MASGQTSRLHLPYPLSSDATNIPGDVQALATALDAAFVYTAGTLAARPAAGTVGRFYEATDQTPVTWFLDLGASWVQVFPSNNLPNLQTYNEQLVAVALAGGTATLDLSAGRQFKVSLTANATVAFSNVPATSGLRISVGVTFVQDATGGRTISLPGTVNWGSAGVPIWSTGANKRDFAAFVSDDNGSSWLGFAGGLGF